MASKASEEEKAKNNAYMKSCRAKCTINIQSWILEVVSQVPLYISTCCDQLWYNHSVFCVDSPTQILTSISVIRHVLMTLHGFVKHAIITWLKTEFHHVLLSMVWHSHKNQHFLSQ